MGCIVLVLVTIFQFQNCSEQKLDLNSKNSIPDPVLKNLMSHQLLPQTPGPLPLNTRSFTNSESTLIVVVSGSGFRLTLAGKIGMSVSLDGVTIGSASSYTNELASHKAFSSSAIVVNGVAKGAHTITLLPLIGTLTNADDFFNVTVMEIPDNSGFSSQHLAKQQVGPLPVSPASFLTSGGDLLIMTSGTAYNTIASQIFLGIQFDGANLAGLSTFSNEPNSHKLLASKAVVKRGVEAGSHQINLSSSSALSNSDDIFDVAVLEVPSRVKLTQISDIRGALPSISSFTTSGGKVLVFVNGSGYRTNAGGRGLIGMFVAIDGVNVGTAKVLTNEVLSHKVFVPSVITLNNLAAGNHSISLLHMPETTSDVNDFFDITILETP